MPGSDPIWEYTVPYCPVLEYVVYARASTGQYQKRAIPTNSFLSREIWVYIDEPSTTPLSNGIKRYCRLVQVNARYRRLLLGAAVGCSTRMQAQGQYTAIVSTAMIHTIYDPRNPTRIYLISFMSLFGRRIRSTNTFSPDFPLAW